MLTYIKKYEYLTVIGWGMFLFIPFLGAVHLFDWDEINFAESAREMLVTKNYQQVQINYQPFIEKPPLFLWLQALSMYIFGVNEFAARLPNALVGIVTLVFIFFIAKKHFDRKFAFIWVLFVTGSFTPHLYFKSGIIDPLFNLFIFSAIYQLVLYTNGLPKAKNAIWFGVFIGFAIITKGPVALIVAFLCFLVYWVQQKFKLFFNFKHIIYAALAAFLVSSFWFGFETIKNGPTFLIEFIKYQADLFLNPVAGHGQPFYYHPLVLLFGAFPASVIALPAVLAKVKSHNTEQTNLVKWMQILFWVVLVLFSIVKTKIVHYSSLCYLPLTFLAAYYTYNLLVNNKNLKLVQTILLAFIGLIFGLLITALTLIDIFKERFIPLIEDEFTVGNLSIDGNWLGFEVFTGLSFIAVLVVVVVKIFKKKTITGIAVLLLFISVFIPTLLRIIVPHIERYSQRSAIEFYQELQHEDCYVECIGFKSYAQYFYTKTLPKTNTNYNNNNWLLTAALDKPAYFVLKEGQTKDHLNPTMILLYQKGGFVFYKREAGIPFIDEQTEQK